MVQQVQSVVRRLSGKWSLVQWIVWGLINVTVASYFGFALLAPASDIKTAWLPGTTTHGHYQIELDCNACHASSSGEGEPSADDVMQDACNRCHADQLKMVRDTHPAKKFNDPTNADLLLVLDAQNCLSCHEEHVPRQTNPMGLTMPTDYCWHCHQDVAESRPSHEGMRFDSCATAGCHNYHNNLALYEKFLGDHADEPDFLDVSFVLARDTAGGLSDSSWPKPELRLVDADHPSTVDATEDLLNDWADTSHATAGVNCTHCHASTGEDGAELVGGGWKDNVSMDACKTCHENQVASFQRGKHGMRLASGLPAMTPSNARLPMHAGAAHAEMTCNACHAGHRFDTQFAATEACLQCHADDHSLAYRETSHAKAWADEMTGAAAANSGVSCATCHLPRLDGDDGVFVQHDQNSNLRPNETMAREVCLNCHGLEYSLSSLADPDSVRNCFGEPPAERNDSVRMAKEWFESKAKKRRSRGSSSG
ncbi:MAG: cytochrome c3 family protein [Planctomycetota bacterium]